MSPCDSFSQSQKSPFCHGVDHENQQQVQAVTRYQEVPCGRL